MADPRVEAAARALHATSEEAAERTFPAYEDWADDWRKQAAAILAAADSVDPHREKLEEALRAMLDVSGCCHMVMDGPNAGWRDGDWVDDDIPDPNCAVCAAEKLAREALQLPDERNTDA